MPTYVYECQACGGTLERRQSFSDAALTTHEGCGGSLRRVVYASPVIFKGSGFYNTDNRSSSSANGAPSPSKNGAKADTAKSTSAGGATDKADSTTPAKSSD
ncbi:MAG: FmdB family transcriptional regulator [Chloroflexi bacterium]|nr:FmdB family transcriptional regulator [Chloroflexota bacterium]